MSAVYLACALVAGTLLNASPVPANPTASERELLELLNKARADPKAYGESLRPPLDLSNVVPSPPLELNADLQKAAQVHADDMRDRKYFSHTTPEGVTFDQRILATGLHPVLNQMAESVAAGYSDPAKVLEQLIRDEGDPNHGHRNQLLAITAEMKQQSHVGIGIALGGTGELKNFTTIDTAHLNE